MINRSIYIFPLHHVVKSVAFEWIGARSILFQLRELHTETSSGENKYTFVNNICVKLKSFEPQEEHDGQKSEEETIFSKN